MTSSEDSGSSSANRRGAVSMVVTAAPKRRKTWPSSRPIAPPPITIRLSGTVSVSIASRLVQYGVSASPSIGGAQARVAGIEEDGPARLEDLVADDDLVGGPRARAQPRTNVDPLGLEAVHRHRSSQLSVASSRIRRATGAKSGVTSACPAIPSIRRASVSRLAARIIILEGTHPQ